MRGGKADEPLGVPSGEEFHITRPSHGDYPCRSLHRRGRFAVVHAILLNEITELLQGRRHQLGGTSNEGGRHGLSVGNVGGRADDIFEHPRLVAIYDALDPDRTDLNVYAAIADDLGATSVLDVGCGTGTFALLLAHRGLEVTGVDPATGSLGVAKAKPGAERVHWIHGDATALPLMQVDLVTMTANVAQAIVDSSDWKGTLRGAHDALSPGGHLVFETRDPAHRAWQEWNRAASYRVTEIRGVGAVESWVELTDVSGPLVSFRGTWVFASDGQVLTSDSTLRFRERDEVEAALLAHGYDVDEVRGAPDRPGREFVFFARRTRGVGSSPVAKTTR